MKQIKLAVYLPNICNFKLNGQLFLVYLQKVWETIISCINQYFGAESQFKNPEFRTNTKSFAGCAAQLITCLATDACLTADPGVTSSIQAQSHTFMEIDPEIISTVILLPSAGSFKKSCCQLQAKVCARSSG